MSQLAHIMTNVPVAPTSQLGLDWLSTMTQQIGTSMGETLSRAAHYANTANPTAVKQLGHHVEMVEHLLMSAAQSVYRLGIAMQEHPWMKSLAQLLRQPVVQTAVQVRSAAGAATSGKFNEMASVTVKTLPHAVVVPPLPFMRPSSSLSV